MDINCLDVLHSYEYECGGGSLVTNEDLRWAQIFS